MEFRSLSVESLDFSKQRYNSFMRFEKGFLGKFGEKIVGLPGISAVVFLRLCPAAGHIATNLTTCTIQFASALEIVFEFELVGC